jgi:hypothetical protein
VLIFSLGCAALGQQDSKDRTLLDKAANNGTALPTQITVRNSVTAQAVLIPRVDARRIFGQEIADNYAVIEVNVGNKSPDAALIIHGIFIDYSRWALSGTINSPQPNTIDGVLRERSEPFQASTRPNQIASEEYRVVRGQLLDAQMWSKRNWTMRLLTLAGNLAGAYAFSISEKGILKGLNAFSGVFVPGIREAWPDGTIAQLNRVSDFGYQANKVISKQGAEVIVCFFPIDRFLTPGFRKLFLKSPALFFAPLQMLVDRKIQNDVAAVLGVDLGINANLDELRRALPCYLRVVGERRIGSATCLDEFGLEENTENNVTKIVVKNDAGSKQKFNNFLALDFISQMSLNSVNVTVDGIMTVDTTTIAAKIDDVAFDKIANCGDDTTPCLWTNIEAGNGVRTGTIPGSYLTGGNVAIAEATDLGLTEVKTISDGSSDQVLHFSFKLTKPVPPETKLHFTVVKPQPGSPGTNVKTLDSIPWEYLVHYTFSAPKVTEVKQEGSKLTIKGSGFYDVPPTFPLIIKLHSPTGEDVEVTPTSATSTQLVLTVPADAQPAGCWTVQVSVGANPAPEAETNCFCFVVTPSPTLESAKRQNNHIIVTGTDLIDTRSCGGPKLSFQLLKEGGTPVAATGIRLISPTQVLLDLPAAAKDGSWTVKPLLDGKAVAGSNPVQLQ